MDQTRLVETDRAAYLTGLPHRVQWPEGDGPHPVIVMLHGRHGTEDVTWIFRRTLPKHCLIVAPRATEFDPEDPESGQPGYSWLIQDRQTWPDLDAFRPPARAIYDFVRALPEAYDVDPEQLYFLGFSQGAAVAYATGLIYPNLVRGIAGLVGFAPRVSPTALVDKPLAHLPIFMAVGREDDRVPLAVARTCRETLQAAGASLTVHEYPTGHKLNSQGMRDLTAWWEAREIGTRP